MLNLQPYKGEKAESEAQESQEQEVSEQWYDHTPQVVSDCKGHYFEDTSRDEEGRQNARCKNCWQGMIYNPDTHYLYKGKLEKIERSKNGKSRKSRKVNGKR